MAAINQMSVNSDFLHNVFCVMAVIWASIEHSLDLASHNTSIENISMLLTEILKEGNNPERTRTLPQKAPGLLR